MKQKIRVAGALIIIGLALAGAGACARNEGPGAGWEIRKVEITPAAARTGDVLRAVVEAGNSAETEVALEFLWFVNGNESGSKGPAFETQALKKGDEILVKVRGKDIKTGLAGKWKQSAVVKLGEALPLGVDIRPQPLYQFTPAQAVVDWGKSNQEDAKLFYRWTVNDKIVEGDDAQGPELPNRHFKRKDTIKASVSTDEKFPSSKTKDSPVYTVANAPPEWKSPQVRMEGDFAFLQLSAGDPEGDPLEYYIVDAPNGAGLDDPTGGLVHVDLKAVEPGNYQLTFGVKDGQGGDAQYSTNLTVPEPEPPPLKSPEQPAEPPAEAPAPAAAPMQQVEPGYFIIPFLPGRGHEHRGERPPSAIPPEHHRRRDKDDHHPDPEKKGPPPGRP